MYNAVHTNVQYMQLKYFFCCYSKDLKNLLIDVLSFFNFHKIVIAKQ